MGAHEAGVAIAMLRALATYRRAVVPCVRQELRKWEAVAMQVPDDQLRARALATLREKTANVEATAVFAILVPRRRRAAAICAMSAFQVAVDYLDTLGEQPSKDPLANGLALHEALVDALTPRAPLSDWHRLADRDEDGGYLERLVQTCREPSHRFRQPRQPSLLPAAPPRVAGQGKATPMPPSLAAAQRCAIGLRISKFRRAMSGGSAPPGPALPLRHTR